MRPAGIWLFANGVQTPVVGIVERVADRRRGRRSRRRARPAVGTENVRVSDRLHPLCLRSCRRRTSGCARAARRARRRTGSGAAAASAGSPAGSSSASRTRRCDGTRSRLPWNALRAGLGRDVDQRRRLAAELRRVHRLLDLELLDRVDRRVDHQVVEQLVGDLGAVEQVDVVARSAGRRRWAAGRPAAAPRRACRPAE